MAWFSRKRASHSSGAVLRIENLDVYYGRAHALQGVSLTLEHGAVAVIELFGTRRAMFASNYPVDSLRASFDAIYSGFDEITRGFSDAERRGLFHDNAVRIYRME